MGPVNGVHVTLIAVGKHVPAHSLAFLHGQQGQISFDPPVDAVQSVELSGKPDQQPSSWAVFSLTRQVRFEVLASRLVKDREGCKQTRDRRL